MAYVVDGNLSEWSAGQRLDSAATGAAGFQLFGKAESNAFVFALQSDTATIGANTTFWFNTDWNAGTGFQIFGSTGGAEYNVNFDALGTPALFTGDAGQTPVSGTIQYAYSADKKIVEFVVPFSLIGEVGGSAEVFADVNNTAFLPNAFANGGFKVGTVVRTDTELKVGIVYSETTANRFFDKTAYGHLFMSAQNQAAMAGTPFDILTEADLTDVAKLKAYDTLVFPSFANVPSDKLAAIKAALTSAVFDHGVGLVTAGNFMTNDETGAALPGDSYATSKLLLGVARVDGANAANVSVVAGDVSHPIMQGYAAGELIRNYANIGTSFFQGTDPGAVSVAKQVVGSTTYDAILATHTGGKNVHFATEGMLADNNMLSDALQWSAYQDGEPQLGLRMSRNKSIFASRTDMDQAQEASEVNPDLDGNTKPGIYDLLLPILDKWKQDFNFVGSYYIDIGNNRPQGQYTDWAVSKPYYDRLLAAGNEIGSHSYTHPDDTNALNASQLQFEFGQSKQVIEQQLGISIAGAAIPGMPEKFTVSQAVLQYYDYLTGGNAMIGAGYPGAFGYLTPADASKVYLAPNISSDFTLIGFKQLSAAQASAAWASEFADMTARADLPVIVFPWHDYGPTNWGQDGYTEQMFTDFIRTAYQAGAEFVTLADLASRIEAFDQARVSFSGSGNVITASVASEGGLGAFALDLGGASKIKNVSGWYAYDADSVFLAEGGGTFTINLGDAQDDVTHIAALPARARLLSVSGNGEALDFSLIGEGKVLVDLKSVSGTTAAVTGARIVSQAGDKLELSLDSIGQHTVSVKLSATPPANTPPVFASAASFDAPENQTGVGTVTATDADAGQTLSYGIAGGTDAALFQINASTGVLQFVTPQDYEAGKTVFNLTVSVSDGVASPVTQALTVNLKDVPEAGITVPTDVDAAANAVAENAAAGTLVGVTARATDADVGDTVSYSLTTNPGGLFAINAATGVVSVANGVTIDREALGASVTLGVTATSSDGSAQAQNFAIAVNDVDEFNVSTPVDANAATNTVAENATIGTAVGITAQASDADATTNVVSYSLTDNAGGRFAIDAASGVVTLARLLDAQTPAAPSITVRATSADGSTADSNFTIAVGDVPPPSPGTVTIGTGPDSLVLKVAQDAYLGSAQYDIRVDGVKINDAPLTAAALQSSGQTDTVTVLGNWGPGNRVLTVDFLNDAWGGTPTTDRNLYVNTITFDDDTAAPVTVSSTTTALERPGPVNFGFTVGTTTPIPPGTVTIGDGPDSLVLKIAQDAYLGSAQYDIRVDGVKINGTLTAAALQSSGQSDTVTVKGNWGPGNHAVSVDFLNDAWGGTPATDRNLYVNGITYDDADAAPVTVSSTTTALEVPGPVIFAFTVGNTTPPPSPGTVTIGTGPDSLVLKVAQDAYLGSAQYDIRVDGVKINDAPLTAAALQSSGQTDTVTVLGNWGPGNRVLTVDFLNDAWGGTPTTDRNLYVNTITFDDDTAAPVTVSSTTTALERPGPVNFGFTVGTTTPIPPGTVTIGDGPDSLVLKIAQDAYLGSAQYDIRVDGVKINGTLTAAALQSSGQSDTVTVKGNWGPGNHAVSVDFLNDAWGGTPATDRNLYVNGITYDDADAAPVTVSSTTTALEVPGPVIFAFAGAGVATTASAASPDLMF